jgi:hypothetical protein
MIDNALRTVVNVVGFKPKAVVDYTRVSLPQIGEVFKGGQVKELKVVAMSDGIENYSSLDQQIQAFRHPSANGVAAGLLELGRAADADDRSVVAAEVVQTKEKELTPDEKVFVDTLENLNEAEKSTGPIDAKKLQQLFQNMRSYFSRLPSGGQLRGEVMKGVVEQLGAEAEKLKKAGKTDGQIYDEWLKRVFIPLYRRTKKQP